MDKTDLLVIKLLARGHNQSEVSKILRRLGYEPNSVSMIEKRVKAIKKEYRAKTIFHLAVILTRRKII